MKVSTFTYLFSVAVITLSSCSNNVDATDESVYVNVVEAVNADRLGTHSFTGKTKAAEEANVAFRVSGPISSIRVKVGDRVSKGQVIAEMDNRDYQVQLNATQAEYDQVKADAERVIALYKEGNTTSQNYDKARYGLQRITQKLENHKNQLADTKLRTPISGYVKEKLHEAGETVGAGMPVLTISGGVGLEVEIYMSAQDYARRDKFTSYYCQFDLYGDEKFPLKIVSVSSEANVSQLYTVRLRIDGEYDTKKITAGMSTMVYAAEEEEDHGVVNLPTSAILSKNGKTSVFVYNAQNGVVNQHDVEVLDLNRDGSVNLKGLKKGTKIVSTGVHHLVDGAKVKPLAPKTSTNVGGLL
ncbi:MAG: efflux RND transporter periplasmic adaptor subunit [Bacteroidaceae bacterium]|nr:efflux RND transporter periplasmic adaptor subunit [Bacteroidaceae bacterium]